MLSLPKHLSQILNTAAKRAMPELPDMMVVVEPEKNKDWEYKSASAMKIYNTYKKAGSFGFPTC